MDNFNLPNFIVDSLSHGSLHLLILDVLNDEQFKDYTWFNNFEQNEILPYIKAYVADQLIKEIYTKARTLGANDYDDMDDIVDFEDEDLDYDDYDPDEIVDFEDEDLDYDDLDDLDDYEGDIYSLQDRLDNADEDDELYALSTNKIVEDVYESFITDRQKIINIINDFDLEVSEASRKTEDIKSDYILRRLKLFSINNMRTTKEYYDLSKSDEFIMKKINENSVLSSFPEGQKLIILETIKCLIVYNMKVDDPLKDDELELTSNFMDSIIGEAIDIYTSKDDELSDLIYSRDLTRKYIRSLKKIIKDNGFDK